MRSSTKSPVYSGFTALALLAAPSVGLAAGPLGEIPEPGGFTSYWRILLILLMVIPWLLFCQWVDKDTQFVRKVSREKWNLIVLGGGTVGLAVWLLLPWTTTGLFVAGFGLWFMITAGSCAVYVIVRNGVVDAKSRVFTPQHLRKAMGSLGRKDVRMDSVERVKLTAHNGSKVTPPTDPNQTDAYDAAQSLLFDAFWRRATEVEMIVAAAGIRLVYRIDGIPVPRHELLTPEAARHALTFLKTVAGLDVAEHRKPQEGAIRGQIVGAEGGATEVEVHSSGTTQQERLSLKIISEQNRLRITDLGMEAKQQAKFEACCGEKQGLVVVSGPRGSGVTTTLYAALRSHDAFMQNLLTLEYEPLMDLENITQNKYDVGKHDVSYARQLQTVLRREPDVVMVSDCADRETAHHVAEAAVNGKKIYVGMQAKDSFEALKKLVSLAGDSDAVSRALVAITCQRLVRKLCIACRQAYKPDAALLKKANIPADKIEHFYRPPPEGLVDAKGHPIICTNCQGNGYFGRTAIYEVLEVDDVIREMIRSGQPTSAIRAQARKNGMLYLQETGLQKVISGVTSMNEALRVMRDEEAPAKAAAK